MSPKKLLLRKCKLPLVLFDRLDGTHEVILTKSVSLHRLNLKNEMLQLFEQEDDFDSRGNLEDGVGIGVHRDAFCVFFTELFLANTCGREEKVPSIRHLTWGDLNENQSQESRILSHCVIADFLYFNSLL